MRKWGKVAVAVLLVGLVGWFALSSPKPPEPAYQGRRLSQWLDICNETSNIDDTRPVSEALHAMGTNCLPFLVAHVGHTQSRVKTWLLTQLCKQKLVKLPYYADDRYASVSTWAMKELGPIAAPAVPEL